MHKAFAIKLRGLFDPLSDKPFKVSRSGVELFIECPRCFYLNHRLGIRRPSGPPFSINSLVDRLLKKEFDIHRSDGSAHPLMSRYGIDAIPYQHPQIDEWRANFKGLRYHHQPTNLLFAGAIDDLWTNASGELIVVDYKATAKSGEVTIDAEWQQSYKRQMEMYQWLVRRQGLPVSDTGYFVYCNGQDAAAFDGRIEFAIKLLPYAGSDSWVEATLLDVKKCLVSDAIPNASHNCEFCGYAAARLSSEIEKSGPINEQLKHRTNRGEFVRSKSEAFIANKLHERQIDYAYEKPIVTVQGRTRYPDFTITDQSRGITYYWEHLMALDDAIYREHCERSHSHYLAAGVKPWQDGGGVNGTLIETRDELGGDPNVGMIEKLIDEVVLCKK